MQSEEAKQRDVREAALGGHHSLWAHIVEMHAAKPKDQRLRLAYPLTSRSVPGWEVHDLGNTTETQLTVESVGRNGVKRVVDALVRRATADRAVESILTIHTKLFVRHQDRIPAFKFLQTFIIDEINDIAEAGCSRGEVFVTVVDETGVYRSPVAEVKTFL